MIFEFHGCFWHGCPKCYPDREKENQKCKKSFRELYENTMKKEQICKDNNYNYISIWECQWKNIKKDTNKQSEYLINLKELLNIS